MSNRLMIFMGGGLAAVLVAVGVMAVLKVDLAPTDEKGKRPARTQNLGEGIKVSRHGLYGVDLVTIGKAYMRKLRKGPFTIGAINELVLEDVALTLPEDSWKGKGKVKVEGQGQERNVSNSSVQSPTSNLQPDSGPKAMLSKLGINAGNLKMGGKMPRFSALAIRGLKVSRLEGTNAVPWFAAKRAEAKREGLVLENGFTMENGQPVGWSEALLVFEPELRLLR